MGDEALDRLACVSRLLMDQRVIDLRRENERLKMCLFWRDHGTMQLRECLMYANLFAPGAPGCRCISCCINKGTYDVDMDNPCKFYYWIKDMMERHGMTVEIQKEAMAVVSSHPSSPGYVCDQDCHFVVRTDWFERAYFTYGARIWRAETVSDVNLQKLARFFDELQLDK